MKRCGRALTLVAIVVGAVLGLGPGGWLWSPAAAQQAAQVRFAESSLQVVENRLQVRVLVERVDLPVSKVLVHYRTEDVAESAEADADYVHTAGTLVFDVGTRSGVFTVWVRNDEVAEETEHLLLHLETSSGSGASSRLTILDDDLPPIDEDPPAAVAANAPAGGGGPSATSSPAPVVVASSAGSTRPVAVAPGRAARSRAVTARPAAPRRIILQQTPTTPFELRPMGEGVGGAMTSVDPLLALAAGLLLARVGAEVWFRARIALA